MTFSVNGIGTTLVGGQFIGPEESLDSNMQFKMATESFTIFFIPIIPLQTIIYRDVNTGWFENKKYEIVAYPVGEGNVYWEHVKDTWAFYSAPVILAMILVYNLLY